MDEQEVPSSRLVPTQIHACRYNMVCVPPRTVTSGDSDQATEEDQAEPVSASLCKKQQEKHYQSPAK